MERLKHISISDNITFKYNYEVINACFDGQYTTYFDDATKPTGDGCRAWFPKMAYKNRDGIWKSGSGRVNWKNRIGDNNSIIQWLEQNENPTEAVDEFKFEPNPSPLHCFMQDSHNGQDYKYIGTYLCDFNSSTLRERIYRRIGTEIDLTVWYEHGDFSYLNRNVVGYDYLKNVYIGHSFEKQKKYEDAFNENLDKYLDEEKAYKAGLTTFLEECGVKSIPRNEGEFSKFSEVLAQKISERFNMFVQPDKFNPGVPINERGLAFVDIIMCDEDKHFHNDTIRKSVFGEFAASLLLAAYHFEYYLYSLSEEETEYYLDKLDVPYEKSMDLTEKHCLLQFWKQCNHTMYEWSNYLFYKFLEETFGNPLKISSEEKAALIDFSPYTFCKWLTDDRKVSLVRDNVGHAFVRKIMDTVNVSVIEKLKELKPYGIPQIYSFKQVGHSLITVEEYIDNGTVNDLVEKSGVLAPQKVIDIGVQLCDILEGLHNLNPPIIHRDIKPSNIGIRRNGQIVLIDFSISREYKVDSIEDTVNGFTFGFAAPEQLELGEQTDNRTDIYLLGVTMYYLLTKSLNRKLIVAGKLKPVIEKCTKRERKDRYQTVSELKEALISLQ